MQLQLVQAQQKQLPQLRRIPPGFYKNVKNDKGNTQYRQENIIHALNCAGEEFTDTRGITYVSDAPYVLGGAEPEEASGHFSVSRVAAKDQELYHTCQQAAQDGIGALIYRLPIPKDGDFVAILKFANILNVRSSEPLVFDIIMNNVLLVGDLDVNELAGVATAHHEYIPFTVSDGRRYFKLADGQKYPMADKGVIEIELRRFDYAGGCDACEDDSDYPFLNTADDSASTQDDEKSGEKLAPYICSLVIFHGKLEDVPKLIVPFKLQPNTKNYWLENLEWFEADIGRYMNHESATIYEDLSVEEENLVAIKSICLYPVGDCVI
ncbi:hypothetical protein SARC_12394 [Sphaeroforma arctica JP610]|uniref:Malectin domain-containing protein n=1 Tax=Sphaeroforma arctica JP610 TaxID=667725 RepID=A0A0L0FE94_9EUKA|nr:hypothetical protein SARC_12394 [Sphaeroforma arctica JP610]KNC75074.1 hypothetical protein SARC_12394 [Sphaeroforma arctica JP610]|eukprot:XP_014148976.1 hypothetical protein SARC_12394 [Sphaeroforma arctica JP610]